MIAKKSFYSGLALFVLMTASALAQGTDRPWSKAVSLEPTVAGQVADAKGEALIGSQNGVEYFAARLNAPLRNGTVVVVKAQKGKGQPVFTVGSFQMVLSSGLLELKSSVDPSPVFPVRELTMIEIYLGSDCLVRGYIN